MPLEWKDDQGNDFYGNSYTPLSVHLRNSTEFDLIGLHENIWDNIVKDLLTEAWKEEDGTGDWHINQRALRVEQMLEAMHFYIIRGLANLDEDKVEVGAPPAPQLPSRVSFVCITCRGRCPDLT